MDYTELQPLDELPKELKRIIKNRFITANYIRKHFSERYKSSDQLTHIATSDDLFTTMEKQWSVFNSKLLSSYRRGYISICKKNRYFGQFLLPRIDALGSTFSGLIQTDKFSIAIKCERVYAGSTEIFHITELFIKPAASKKIFKVVYNPFRKLAVCTLTIFNINIKKKYREVFKAQFAEVKTPSGIQQVLLHNPSNPMAREKLNSNGLTITKYVYRNGIKTKELFYTPSRKNKVGKLRQIKFKSSAGRAVYTPHDDSLILVFNQSNFRYERVIDGPNGQPSVGYERTIRFRRRGGESSLVALMHHGSRHNRTDSCLVHDIFTRQLYKRFEVRFNRLGEPIN